MVHARIRELEKNLVKGDIASASRTIAQIYACREALDRAEQKDLTVLEAIYLSLVHMAARPHHRPKSPPQLSGFGSKPSSGF